MGESEQKITEYLEKQAPLRIAGRKYVSFSGWISLGGEHYFKKIWVTSIATKTTRTGNCIVVGRILC